MRSKVFLFLMFVALLPLSAQQLKSTGLIIGFGGEHLKYSALPRLSVDEYDTKRYKLDETWLDGDLGMEFGYRFRFQPKKKIFFYDLDILGGYRKYKGQTCLIHTFNTDMDPMYQFTELSYHKRSQLLLSVSVAGTFNYKIIKGLYVGVGLQPAYHCYDISTPTFDLFVSGKIGYDLGFLDLSVSYKQGLMNKLNLRGYTDSRLSGWQVSLYVPFSQHQKKK